MSQAAFSELVRARSSVRDYTDQEVEQKVLEAIMEDVKWTPSWCNTHPYMLCIARGDKLVRIRDKLCSLYDDSVAASKGGILAQAVLYAKGGAPDGDFNAMLKYPPTLQKRRVDCAKGLYGLMEIPRADKAKREAQDRRNFEFFGAPVVFFVFVQGDMGPFSPLDAGFALDTLMLSAHARGLGTCAQGSLAMWGSPVREEFPTVPAGYKLLCGLSMGHPKAGSRVNTFKPEREPVDVIGL